MNIIIFKHIIYYHSNINKKKREESESAIIYVTKSSQVQISKPQL